MKHRPMRTAKQRQAPRHPRRTKSMQMGARHALYWFTASGRVDLARGVQIGRVTTYCDGVPAAKLEAKWVRKLERRDVRDKDDSL